MRADEDDLARRRAERTKHPSRLPPVPLNDLRDEPIDGARSVKDPGSQLDAMPMLLQARLDALQGLVAEVADDLEQRGINDAAERLRGGLP